MDAPRRLVAIPGARQGDALLTVDEAAKRLGCSGRTVFRLIKHRELPSTKVGRQRLITVDDVDAYLRDLRTASTT